MPNIIVPHLFTESVLHIRSYQAVVSTHTHPYSQWVLPLTGRLELQIENQVGQVDAQHAAFIAPEHAHCFLSEQENLFLVLDILQTNTVINPLDIPCFLDMTPTLKHFLQFAKCYLLQQDYRTIDNEKIKEFLLQLLLQPFMQKWDEKVLRATQWINSHLAAPIDPNTVAQHCYLSVSQLQRRFKQVMGYGVAKYWRTARLKQAQRLLCQSSCSIERIANQVGYENLSVFSRMFMQNFGTTPSQWRNMQRIANKMRCNDK